MKWFTICLKCVQDAVTTLIPFAFCLSHTHRVVRSTWWERTLGCLVWRVRSWTPRDQSQWTLRSPTSLYLGFRLDPYQHTSHTDQSCFVFFFCSALKGAISDIQLFRLPEKQILLCIDLAASWHVQQKVTSRVLCVAVVFRLRGQPRSHVHACQSPLPPWYCVKKQQQAANEHRLMLTTTQPAKRYPKL